MVTSISEEQINALFLILDVGQMIENSAVFQAQVVDQVLALRKLDYSVVVMCAFSDREKFQQAAGNKLNEYKVPKKLYPSKVSYSEPLAQESYALPIEPRRL